MHELLNKMTFSYMSLWYFGNDLTQTFVFEKSCFKYISKTPFIYKHSKSLRINLIVGVYNVFLKISHLNSEICPGDNQIKQNQNDININSNLS